jgi:hypothetical protein
VRENGVNDAEMMNILPGMLSTRATVCSYGGLEHYGRDHVLSR